MYTKFGLNTQDTDRTPLLENTTVERLTGCPFSDELEKEKERRKKNQGCLLAEGGGLFIGEPQRLEINFDG